MIEKLQTFICFIIFTSKRELATDFAQTCFSHVRDVFTFPYLILLYHRGLLHRVPRVRILGLLRFVSCIRQWCSAQLR